MISTPAQSIFEIQAEFCKAMGNATRLQIIYTLRDHPMKVGEIAEVTGFGQSLVSRQLSTLRGVGVVECQRQGNEMIYQLADKDIDEVCDLVRKVLTAHMQRQSEAFRSRALSILLSPTLQCSQWATGHCKVKAEN